MISKTVEVIRGKYKGIKGVVVNQSDKSYIIFTNGLTYIVSRNNVKDIVQ